jgi:hypothetical protein
MKKQRDNGALNIRFHNPNTPEETVKYLTKFAAERLVQQVNSGLDIDEDRSLTTNAGNEKMAV